MNKPAVERLQDALERLLEGKPERVKATGRLTLNKINREAGLGQSYIHKFKTFINETANPTIEKYNNNLNNPTSDCLSTAPTSVEASVVDKFKADLKREENLKVKYRKERDELNARLKELESINNTLMYRVYELQGELSFSVHEMKDKGLNE
ncbi:KfrA N-terminal DNA-binding domain-containing protein [Vibrio crassostreae]|uniref:KfrA N-terminal DNA-binding domain-containing protein n=1 Tax=Vibrio tapetis subsp. tapetis TaxID=1671868 RepID=A0A2N8ZIA1_9VIBR|nr:MULTISPECIES: hypothetical protein [Vibrio]CAK1917886.1 KfrA N-terminal DNA-binding domain-containing protein [Vibrio crassostreae]OMO28186.1 hypothetical protein BH581_11250 [Vibrio splendidus]CAK1919610.1 KfrA N-terminal DNA-binding domain-containing protein [Vibrio crassostreae]CAK1938037.1 KfrA N-terminal DNA-binding domain-containing protein [Vibrio crassostreae]CAK1941670.1 KfrA N-terminal DNA-binding domain-containing protein [Vibrio crassostreae]